MWKPSPWSNWQHPFRPPEILPTLLPPETGPFTVSLVSRVEGLGLTPSAVQYRALTQVPSEGHSRLGGSEGSPRLVSVDSGPTTPSSPFPSPGEEYQGTLSGLFRATHYLLGVVER